MYNSDVMHDFQNGSLRVVEALRELVEHTRAVLSDGIVGIPISVSLSLVSCSVSSFSIREHLCYEMNATVSVFVTAKSVQTRCP